MATADFNTAPEEPGHATDGKTWVYIDMRGNHWTVDTNFANATRMYTAAPKANAMKAYELPDDRMFATALNKTDLREVIDGNIEEARRAGKSVGKHFADFYKNKGGMPAGTLTVNPDADASPFPWWLIALGVAAYLHDTRGRRR